MSHSALPDKFAYLNDVVQKYTFPHGDVTAYEDLLDRLTRTDLAALAVAYERLAADPEGVRELSAWIKQIEDQKLSVWDRWLAQEKAREAGQPLPGPRMTEPEMPDPPQAFYLFFVFDLLGERGRRPFKSGKVKYSPPPQVLDWTKLPEGLRWISGPAQKYGKHAFHDDRVRFAKRLKPEEREELREVVRRAWSSPASVKQFQDWVMAHPASKHPETNLINALWDLIVGLGEADDDKRPEWMRNR